MSVACQGQAVPPAAGHLNDVFKPRNSDWQQFLPVAVVHTRLTVFIASADKYGAVLHQKQRAHISALNVQNVVSIESDSCFFRKENLPASAITQLGPGIVAPAPDIALIVHRQVIGSAEAKHDFPHALQGHQNQTQDQDQCQRLFNHFSDPPMFRSLH